MSNHKNDISFCPQQGETKLTKSLTAKEIEEDYKNYRIHHFLNTQQDRLKTADLIEKALINVPLEGRKTIEEHLKLLRKNIPGDKR